MALWRALAIEGRVLDPWETGMANVQVIVKRVTDRVRPFAHATADDRGMYRVYGLAPGRYRVCVEIEHSLESGGETTRLGSTCYPAAADDTAAGEVVLTSDDATGIDVRVQQFRTHSLLGSVVDATGSPVTGARVNAHPVDADGPSSSGTTRRGEFVLNGLAPRRYVVRAAVGERPPDDARGDGDAEVGYAFADLSAGDVGSVVVSLSKPVEVAGTVVFEGAEPGPATRRAGMVVQAGPVPERLGYLDTRPPFSPVEHDLSFKLTRGIAGAGEPASRLVCKVDPLCGKRDHR